MTRIVATAPGKVMLAGEYAVLDGGRAIVAAVDRRAIATLDPSRGTPTASSEFLRAAFDVVALEIGVKRASCILDLSVDTDALRDGDRKLGLGSSAAATVAAVGAALGASERERFAQPDVLRATVARLAAEAHARAQGERGARGSGADVAASTWGGVIGFRRDAPITTLRLPADLQLAFAWTGQPADTATLVASVLAARAANPAPVEAALAQIAAAADALAAASTAEAAVAAIADGGRAMSALAAATGVPLVPPALDALGAALAPLGAAAKTTGAGGGDIVLVAAPASIDREQLDRAIVAAGLAPLTLAVDPLGVEVERASHSAGIMTP